MTISASGSFSTSSGTAITSLTVAGAVVGNVRLFTSILYATGYTVSSISGGGVGTWAHVVSTGSTNGSIGEIWWGAITSTTASTTLTLTWSTTPTGAGVEFASQMFQTTVSSPSWLIQTSNSATATTGTTLTWPNLTPVGTQGYFGCGIPVNSGIVGSTSGYTYLLTADTSVCLYDPAISAPSAPTCTQNVSSGWDTIGAIFGDGSVSSQSFFNFF
jgi:hypothetical protein